jgi:hypothetical protein
VLELDVAMLGATRELNSEGELSGDSTVVGLSCFEVGEPNKPPLPRRFVKLGSLVLFAPTARPYRHPSPNSVANLSKMSLLPCISY